MTRHGDTAAHILVVDDDQRIRQMLTRYFEQEGYRVSVAADGSAMRVQLNDSVDVILLDVVMPGEDGLTLAREVRASSDVGIIMLTGRGDVLDRIVGLEVGADDYIAKPFHLREVLARVKSVLRRATGAALATVGPRIRMGGRVLDLEKRVLVDPTNGKEETLTASEFDLLRIFAEHPNKPLQRDWLLEVTAHREMEAFDRAIDLRITRLRRKIELDPAHPNAIRTVRGVGYMFVPPTH